MSEYLVRFLTTLEVEVVMTAEDEDQAADEAWEVAEAFTHRLGTQVGDRRIRSVNASFDGIGAEHVEPTGDES